MITPANQCLIYQPVWENRPHSIIIKKRPYGPDRENRPNPGPCPFRGPNRTWADSYQGRCSSLLPRQAAHHNHKPARGIYLGAIPGFRTRSVGMTTTSPTTELSLSLHPGSILTFYLLRMRVKVSPSSCVFKCVLRSPPNHFRSNKCVHGQHLQYLTNCKSF
jgi:hypothetical protein